MSSAIRIFLESLEVCLCSPLPAANSFYVGVFKVYLSIAVADIFLLLEVSTWPALHCGLYHMMSLSPGYLRLVCSLLKICILLNILVI